MDFFGLGTGEILLILIVAVIIWGPGKLPEVARTIGKAIGSLRQTSAALTSQIKKELEVEESKEKVHSPSPAAVNPEPPLSSQPPQIDTRELTSGED